LEEPGVSHAAYEETNKQLDKITPGIELFPRSAGDESSQPSPLATGPVTIAGTSGNDDANSPPSPAVLRDGVLLIEPPVSSTKGRGPRKQKKNDVEPPLDGTPLSTYTRKNYGDRECSLSGVQDTHYSTTCPINLD
jgi:hypothetical protein